MTIGAIQKLAKSVGRDHDLAEALWQTGWYEARLLAAYVDDPERVTAAQMDRWCRDFDNWGICDTVCFTLFDRSPHAWRKVPKWAGRRSEFEKRGAFALLAGSPDATARWVGKDALSQLTSPVTMRRLAARAHGPARQRASSKAL